MGNPSRFSCEPLAAERGNPRLVNGALSRRVIEDRHAVVLYAAAAGALLAAVLTVAACSGTPEQERLEVSNRIKDRAAQGSLRNALTNAKAIATNRESYEAASVEALRTVEPTLRFVTDASTGPKAVSISTTARTFIAASLSETGTCFAVMHVIGGGNAYAQRTGEGPCQASGFSADDFIDAWR